MRSISESHSAFVSFTLDKTFYKDYKLITEIGCLQVPLKPMLAVFKNINTIETCTMKIDLAESKLIFDIACKLGIKRIYKLFFEDVVSLQALYARTYPNKLVFKPGPMLESLQNNFQPNLEEITLKVTREFVRISSYIDPNRCKWSKNIFFKFLLISLKANANKLLRTELTVSKQEFLEYNVRDNVDLTFCLKEMKAILSFCETSGQSVSLFYDCPGKPVLLVLQFFSLIEADFVLATLLDQSDTSSISSQTSMDGDGFTSSMPATSSPTSSFPSSMQSIGVSSLTSSTPSSGIYTKEDPGAIPSSLTDIKFNPSSPINMEIGASGTSQKDIDFNMGYVSGSDDESIPIHKINMTEKRRKRPVFSTDFQAFNDDNSNSDQESGDEAMSDVK